MDFNHLLTIDEQLALTPLIQALELIGFTEGQVYRLMQNDFTDYMSFAMLSKSDITHVADAYAKRTPATIANQVAPRNVNRIEFGNNRTMRLIGLMHLVQDHRRRGVSPDGDGNLPVTLDLILEALQNAQVREDHDNCKEIASKAADPGVLTAKMDFQVWIRGFRNYLNAIPGVTGIPLDYVIRESEEPIIDERLGEADYMVGLVMRAPLAGPTFRTDNMKAHGYLVSKIGTGPGAEWIASTLTNRNCRIAFQSLVNYFTGAGNTSRLLSEARSLENTLHYKSERGTVPWAEFLRRANRMFTIYEENDEPKTDNFKCHWLCKAIRSDLQALKGVHHEYQKDEAKGHAMSYTELCVFIGKLILNDATRAPAVHQERNTSAASTSTSRVSFSSDTKGGDNFAYYKSNPNSQAPQEVWEAFNKKQKTAILRARKKGRASSGMSSGNSGGPQKKQKRQASEVTTNTGSSDREAQLLATVQQLTSTVSALMVNPPSDSAGSTVENTESSNAGSQFGGQAAAKRYNTSGLTTNNHRVVAKVHAVPNKFPVTSFEGSVELDTHADTCVLGKNFIVLSYTGRECDVYPYSQDYEAIRNIPIVSGATAVQDRVTGETLILVFNEALWYGDRMNHSLINPNQMRHFGVTVQDNPYDRDNDLTIKEHYAGISLPLSVKGTVVYFDSRSPTMQELTDCRHIVLTSDMPWNPQIVELGCSEVTSNGTDVLAVPDGDDLSVDNVYLASISCVYDHDLFFERIRNVSQVDVPRIRTFVSNKRHSAVSAEELSERWHIGLKQANDTLSVTTQKFTRSAVLPLSRRYRSDRNFYRRHLNHDFSADLYLGRHKSINGNVAAYVFTHKCGFAQAYPQRSKQSAELAESLRRFTMDWGIPRKLTVDGALEQVGPQSEFQQLVRKYDISMHISAPRSPQQNPAEGTIREIRKKWFRVMHAKSVPSRFWDYGVCWVCEVLQRTVSSSRYADGRTPLEIITGETPDISEYLDFGFYDWVFFKENAGMGPVALGRFLGVSHRVGNMMSFWILNVTGRVMSRTTVQRITNLELQEEGQISRCKAFDQAIATFCKDENNVVQPDATVPFYDLPDEPIENDPDYQEEFDRVLSNDQIPEDDFTPDAFDHYMNMELALPRGTDGEMQYAKVVKRVRDESGNPVGVANENPILDTRQYEVEWHDGHREEMFANTIAENLFAQVDDEGNRHVMLRDIIAHRYTDEALSEEDCWVVTHNDLRKRKPTTKGWEVCVEWKDGSTNWIPLKDAKDSYPVQLAEYAISRKLQDRPVFAWWVPYVLRKRERIVSKVKSKYWVRTHKFGIEIPKSVKHAIELDKKNGNTLWWDAIMQEMKNVRIAFEQFKGEKKDLPIGFQEIKCHMIFDVKLGENFRRKARYVAGGHMTKPPASITYSSVVSRESVRIALMVAALNGMEVMTADIQNAYLHARCREKIWVLAGPEFGSEQGTIMIVVRALYGLKSSGAAFRAMLADRLYEIGYRPTRGDPDVWLRPAIHTDGQDVYEYVLVYVDDIFCVSPNTKKTMSQIQEHFKFKNDEVKSPDTYLGASLKLKTIEGVDCWNMSSSKYVNAAVQNVQEKLKERNMVFPTRCYTPLTTGYRPEDDISPELDADDTTYYQELIGILRWAIELGRIDIGCEVSMLSSHLALPRQGHLQQAIHVFGYLKLHPKKSLYFNPGYIDVPPDRFQTYDWSDFYRDAKEEVPLDAPEPRGRPVQISCFVDADHAANRQTRRSQTGILIFLNKAPISWYSKRQNTVESSMFGSEFVAMKTAVEQLQALRLKLRWMGIPLDGPANIFCDNLSVVQSSTQPERTLSKKHNGIAYHKTREAVAAGWIRIAHEPTATNLADLLTKPLSAERRKDLLDCFMH